MRGRCYYQIKQDEFIVSRLSTPEEYVRQWVLSELINFYGYNLSQIEIEKPIRYGTRTGFADIIVLVNDLPLIVVECKRLGYKKHNQSIEQAKSYAASPSVNATFAVYTNGEEWVVRRRGIQGWHPYPDIPKQSDAGEIMIKLDEYQHEWGKINPVLYWWYTPAYGQEALLFLKAIQPIFCAQSRLTNGTSHELIHAIDHVLRATDIKSERNGYHDGKQSIAFQSIQNYLKKLGVKNYAGDRFKYNHHEMTIIPMHQLDAVLKKDLDVHEELEVLAISLLQSLYAQSSEVYACRRVWDVYITSDLLDSLFAYLTLALERNLGVLLPSKGEGSLDSIRDYCKSDWLQHCKEHNQTATLLDFISFIWHVLKTPFIKNNVS